MFDFCIISFLGMPLRAPIKKQQDTFFAGSLPLAANVLAVSFHFRQDRYAVGHYVDDI
jgi:hypothetical protein